MAPTFLELIASRQLWLEEVLKPWCLAAPWKELFQAEQDWTDIAGQVDPNGTLWAWAWSRFPTLVCEGLRGIEETHLVRVTTCYEQTLVGYPDNRESHHGKLRLLCETSPHSGQHALSEAISIDDIVRVERL